MSKTYTIQLLVKTNDLIIINSPVLLLTFDNIEVFLVEIIDETKENEGVVRPESDVYVVQRLCLEFKSGHEPNVVRLKSYEIRQMVIAQLTILFDSDISVVSEVATPVTSAPLRLKHGLREHTSAISTVNLVNNHSIASLRFYGIAQGLKSEPAAYMLLLFASMDALATGTSNSSTSEKQKSFLAEKLSYSEDDAEALIRIRGGLSHGNRRKTNALEELMMHSHKLNNSLVSYFQSELGIDNYRPKDEPGIAALIPLSG